MPHGGREGKVELEVRHEISESKLLQIPPSVGEMARDFEPNVCFPSIATGTFQKAKGTGLGGRFEGTHL